MKFLQTQIRRESIQREKHRRRLITIMAQCTNRASNKRWKAVNERLILLSTPQGRFADGEIRRRPRSPPSSHRAPAARRPERESPGAGPTTPLLFPYPSVVLLTLYPPALCHCPHRPHCWGPHGPTCSIQQQIQQQHESQRPPSTSNARQRQRGQPRSTRRRLSREQAPPEQ